MKKNTHVQIHASVIVVTSKTKYKHDNDAPYSRDNDNILLIKVVRMACD